jgi:long-chain acyl-CoA synthetase
MGTRQFLGWKTPGKVKHFGPTSWRSFQQVGVEAHRFGAALRAVGLIPAPEQTNLNKVTTPSRLAIFENTCAEWMIACTGAFSQSITVTTVYATLGIDAVVEAIQDNIISAIVCNKKDVARLVEKCKSMPTLKTIIYTSDLVGPDEKIALPAAPSGVKIISFEDFVASGDTTKYPPVPPKGNSCAVVMYTSGSTGKPKGVVITHKEVNAVVASADIILEVQDGQDCYLGYLPLAHILEMLAEFTMLAMGCTIAYADPRSLTATGAYPIGALEEFQPTLMAAVPKIWDTIKKGIVAKVRSGPKIVQVLFQTAFEWRTFATRHGFDTPLFNLLVFKKLKKAVGGKLRYALSGGGPLNVEVQDFIRVAFDMAFVQGYGLTETCAATCIQAADDFRGGVAGVPVPAVEIKLVSTPEVGDKAGQPYLSTDRFDVEGNPVFGRGEVAIRGNSVAYGYYMAPDLTKEVFHEDGWFYTGDIGEFLPDGSLRIVDRKKNLVKLKGGEYIAIEKMEMVYGNSDFVDAVAGGICCYGDGDMDRPVALMQLNEHYAMNWAKDNGISGDFKQIRESKELYDAVMKDLNKQHAKNELSHLEKLVAVAFVTEHWTLENGCLTAANKLQRREVIRKFEKEFLAVKEKGIFH